MAVNDGLASLLRDTHRYFRNTISVFEPRLGVVSGIVDHTAHHRGSLAVYARLRGKVPPMPYA